MCTINALQVFPEKDVVVYKFLFSNKSGDIFRSPYYNNFVWEKGKTYETGTETAGNYPFNVPVVNDGFFHSYVYFKDAVLNGRHYSGLMMCRSQIVIGKFIIPKDAVVLKGWDGNFLSRETYCSNKLTFVDVVDGPDEPEEPEYPWDRYEQVKWKPEKKENKNKWK